MVKDDQDKTVSLKIPQRVHSRELFLVSGQLAHPKSGVGYVDLTIQTKQDGGEWITVGETTTDIEGRFKSNLRAPTKKGTYEIRALVPKNKLYIGGSYAAETITVDNSNPNSGGNFLNTFYRWVPLIGMASIGLGMIGVATYKPKNKQDGSEEK